MKIVPLNATTDPKLKIIIAQQANDHAGYTQIGKKKGFILLDSVRNPIGYAFYRKHGPKTIYLDWIWAPGYGVYFLTALESKFRAAGYEKVLLKISVDPTERKEKVLRRLNFYCKMGYKMKDVEFRPKLGPIFVAEKVL